MDAHSAHSAKSAKSGGPEARFRARSKPDPNAPPHIAPTCFHLQDPKTLPRRQFLYGRHCIRGYVSVLVAPGGTGKTAITIAESVDMATGRGLLGPPKKPLRVWYWNGEDPHEELERRFHAACLHFEISEADLGDRLFIDSGLDSPLKIAIQDLRTVKIAVPVVDAVIDSLRRAEIDVFIADPFVTTHQVGENDNTSIGVVADQFKRIAHDANIAVGLIHHVRKHNSGELTAEDSRGGSALVDASRACRVVNIMATKDAETFDIPDRERSRYLRLDDGKQNVTRPAEVATWRKLEDIDLGNVGPNDEPSDHVQVAAPWHPPGVFDGVHEWQLAELQRQMGDQHFAQSPAATDWLGKPVAKVLNIALPKGGRRIRQIIDAWVESGAIVKSERWDPRHKREQPTYVCGRLF